MGLTYFCGRSELLLLAGINPHPSIKPNNMLALVFEFVERRFGLYKHPEQTTRVDAGGARRSVTR